MAGKKLKAGFTIEASYVMGIVLWVLVVIIQHGYKLHDKILSTMTVQEMTELARHEEYGDIGIWSDSGEKALNKILENGNTRTSRLFSCDTLNLKLNKKQMPVLGNSINASATASDFCVDITAPVYEPEEFMRMLTLLE